MSQLASLYCCVDVKLCIKWKTKEQIQKIEMIANIYR